MKIVHFIPGYNFGGIETIFKKLFIYKDFDIEMELIVEDRTPIDKIIELESLGCQVHVIPHLSYNNIFLYYTKFNEIFKKIGDIDIVHSYDVTRSFIFFKLAKKNNIRHRILHARANEVDGTYLKQKTSISLLKHAVNEATCRIANSTTSGDFFYGEKSYKIINNGLDTEEYLFDFSIRKRIRDDLNIESEEFVVGHVGRFTRAKNYPLILKIFYKLQQKLPNSKLLLVGDGPEYDSIVQKIEELGIFNKVIFAGEQVRTNDFYQAMDIFLFPSLYESFGNVAIEAQSSGLKVIASSEIPKEVNVTGTVDFISLNEDSNVWADVIIKNSDYERYSDRNLLQNSGYDIKDHVNQIMSLYNQLLNEGN